MSAIANRRVFLECARDFATKSQITPLDIQTMFDAFSAVLTDLVGVPIVLEVRGDLAAVKKEIEK